MAIAPEQIGIGIGRYFTRPGTHPYDMVEWERREARIQNYKDGTDAFFQPDVEFPKTWSQNSTNIVAQKYFRGTLGTPERETSLRQVIDRIADTITAWGMNDGYFVDEHEGAAFRNELKFILLTQRAAFNSPVWFNIGVKGVPAQGSACFILAVEDTMDAILNWYREEGTIFKGGSGSGINLSNIRSSKEHLKGGGTASGPVSFMRGADASAGTIKCLHHETPIVTDRGVVPIRQVRVGDAVLTRHGYEAIEAVHDNGVRPLVRVQTALGDEILCTPEHRFRVRTAGGETWREAGSLAPDDHVVIDLSSGQVGQPRLLTPVRAGHHNEVSHDLPHVLDEAFALWLGWVYGDGSVTTRSGAKFVAMQIGDGDPELQKRYEQLTKSVFGTSIHIFADRHSDKDDASVSVRFSSSKVIRFLERNGLRKGKAADLRVPDAIVSSPPAVRAAFLAGLFEADGHVANGYPHFSTVSAEFARDVHRLLLSIGIPSHMHRIDDRRAAYGKLPVHVVRVVSGEGVRRFAKLVGFVSERKSTELEMAVERKNASPFESQWHLPHVVEELRAVWASTSDQRLRRAVAPYCKYRVPRGLSLLRARALLEQFPGELGGTSLVQFAEGRDFYTSVAVTPADEAPTFDLTVANVHQYLVNSVVTHNSGGKTRRAAKMVILNTDHPDIEEFIWCKAIEERKARALRDAGFDMDLDGKDSHSIQYQNANNSVRVTDEFMEAVLEDRDWDLKAVTSGETIETVKARSLMRQISEATWECADPGMQFDTTINRWHTAPNTGRINGSNPCCFVGDTLVDTADGMIRFELLEKAAAAGEPLPTVRAFDAAVGGHTFRRILNVWIAGSASRLVDVRTEGGLLLRCTPEHRFLLRDGSYAEALSLKSGTELRGVDDADDDVLDRVASVEMVTLDEAVPVFDLEVEGTHNFAVANEGPFVQHSVVVHNSEYMHLDNSACNLASINLLSYLDVDNDDTFDVEAFKHTVEVMFTAQEIIVGNADYPTEKIADNTRRFRQLGLGYANLGALLMAQGMAYDSDEGRAWAGTITALMTGHAYATSARTAGRMGPFAGYADNAEPMLNVLRMHRGEVAKIDEELVPPELLGAAQKSWDDAVELGERFGVRNSQASVLAPTGTIGLMMDCDTTGIEPDLALTKAKKLVGGGTMFIVNQTIPRALRRLGYSDEQVDTVVAYIDEHKTLMGAPEFNPEHLPVFACSMGDNTIHYMGHVKMMGAVQPFISGAISKCVEGDTLITTADGLVRIGSLRDDEAPDSFRDEVLEVASLDGPQKTDAFYYGGVRPVREVVLRSGHRVVGTPNHRLLVAGLGQLDWMMLEDVLPDEYVAVQYGAELWSSLPARFDDFVPAAAYGCQKHVHVPETMSTELAFLLGAYASEGHTTRSNYTISITNSVDRVLEKVAEAWETVFGVTAKIVRPPDRCAHVLVASKTIVEFFEYLGCGSRASEKRIPDSILQSPRHMVLAFLQGLALDAYATVASAPKWAIRLDAPSLLDDFQAVLTNFGIVHGRVSKLNKIYGKTYDEVYATGEHAQLLLELVPFLEPDKAARASELTALDFTRTANTADVVPGITPRDLYELIPKGRAGRSGRALGRASEFAFLCDERTRHVTRRTLERVSAIPGVVLPEWLQVVLRDNLHFSPVVSVSRGEDREVFDVSVPTTHAFVGNGIVNHNTVNMPEEATVEDVEQLHVEAWRLGIKAVAIYRDNCKVAQPLSTQKKASDSATPADAVERIIEHVIVQEPVRQKLPRTRNSKTFSFRVADCRGFATVAEYEDGRPGELFLNVSKQGSTLAGIMDSFAISVSHGLQYGVPLRAFIETFTNRRFEPAGMTDDPDLRIATSLVDYLFRKLAIEYLPYEERVEIGVLTTGERTQPTLPGVEEAATVDEPMRDALPMEDRAPSAARPPVVDTDIQQLRSSETVICHVCGDIMQRAGSCHACPSCGATSGCS